MLSQFDLPSYLIQQDHMVGWCTLFLTIIGKQPPEHALDIELDEREKHHFWKTKKWAYANLNRLFVRYVYTYIYIAHSWSALTKS